MVVMVVMNRLMKEESKVMVKRKNEKKIYISNGKKKCVVYKSNIFFLNQVVLD